MAAHAYMQEVSGMGKMAREAQSADEVPKNVSNKGVDDETQLLHRVSARDREAYDDLFRRYYPRLCQFAVKMLHQHDLAEEVVDDVMMVVWRKAGSFKGQSLVSTWIFGIAYRLCKKAMSKRHNRQRFDSDVPLEIVVDDNPMSDPASLSINAAFAKTVEEGLARLSVEHQATVRFVAAGRSYAEVGEIMRCPENTVKTRMFYARNQLRQYLEDADHFALRSKK